MKAGFIRVLDAIGTVLQWLSITLWLGQSVLAAAIGVGFFATGLMGLIELPVEDVPKRVLLAVLSFVGMLVALWGSRIGWREFRRELEVMRGLGR